MTVRIQLATESDPVSAFIRWYTWSNWSHIDFVLPSGSLLGARQDGGVQIRQPGYVEFTHTLVLEAPDAPDDIYEHALKQVGKPYSKETILGLAVRQDYGDDSEFDCSEFVTYASLQTSFPFFNTRHADRITPRDYGINPYFHEPKGGK